MSENKDQGIFLNGRQQIIDMLRFMDDADKQKLLGNIKARNAVMARELSEQSLSFKDLFRLSPNHLNAIFSKSNPAVIGLALYSLPRELQRKALSALDRHIAEAAFQVMQKDLTGKAQECKRAQDKIVQTAILLSRQKTIHI